MLLLHLHVTHEIKEPFYNILFFHSFEEIKIKPFYIIKWDYIIAQLNNYNLFLWIKNSSFLIFFQLWSICTNWICLLNWFYFFFFSLWITNYFFLFHTIRNQIFKKRFFWFYPFLNYNPYTNFKFLSSITERCLSIYYFILYFITLFF